MSDFSVDELKRLSAAATPVAKWNASVWCNYDDGGWAACGPHHQSDDGNDEPETDSDLAARRDRDLIAYLGTHREHIIALLRAADALAEAASTLPPACGECQKLFRLSGGTELTTCAHAIGIRQQNIRDAAAAYKKAKGA